MGMAASQARLLTLTARLSDNELRSQSINNAKMRLATESSQASEAYINALNNATLQFTNYDETGASVAQPLTFNALTAYSSYNTQYGLVNSSGQLLVSEAEARIFKDANGDINKYLKAHGLEFTTSYFEKVGDIENQEYPEPFNAVTSSQLQQWYEEYGTYENSIEVENYNKAYSNYISSKNSIAKSLDPVLTKYFTPQGQSEAGFVTENNLASLKNAYKNSINTYSYKNSTTMSFVSQNAVETIETLLNSYSQNNVGGTLTVQNKVTFSNTTDENQIFTMDDLDITVDKDGNIVSVTNTEALGYSSDDTPFSDTNKYTGTYGAGMSFSPGNPTWTPVSTTSLSVFLRGFGIDLYNEDNVKIGSMSAIKNSDNSATISSVYTDNNIIKDELSYLNERLLEILRANTDYTQFGEMILKNQLIAYGIDKNDLTPELQTIVNKCVDSKDAFLNSIFKDSEAKYQFAIAKLDANGKQEIDENGKPVFTYTRTMSIEDAIDNGLINMDNLEDEEYVLMLAKYSKDANGEPLNEQTSFLSNTFKTVIKTYITKNIMEEYGTPKYAWIDQYDTQNTGNADSKAQWYTNLYKRMEKGFKALENGLASSSQWIEYALESGLVTMEQVDKSFNWQSLEFKTCTRITEVTDDAAVAKAEAEYNRAMNDIKSKDNMYDIQLKNIDTEHTSLQTEYDSVKNVINKNIDRTFKFDQSA